MKRRYLQASPFAVPEPVLDYVSALLSALAAPVSLRDRNVIQLGLAHAIEARFGLDPIDAIVAVAGLYGDRFPHPVS